MIAKRRTERQATSPPSLCGFLAAPGDTGRNALCAIDPQADRWMTLGDLQHGVRGVARYLQDQNLSAGDRVAVIADNSPEYLTICLGAAWAGMVAVPINHRLPASTIKEVLTDAGCSYQFADRQRFRDSFVSPSRLRTCVIEDAGPLGLARAKETGLTRPALPVADEAFVLYTSGSSGLPKGVPLSHTGFAWAISKYASLRTLVEDETVVIAAPLFHMNALFSSLLMLQLGARVAFLPRFEAQSYIQAVSKHRCPMLTVIPTMIALMAKETKLLAACDLSSVKVLLTGSAPLSEKTLDIAKLIFPCAQIMNTWGTTESGPACFGAHPSGLPRPALSVGYPIPDVGVRLAGGGSSDEGVLHVRTPAVMRGYLNRPTETASKLKDGWYDTGDIMRRDADGFYYFVGRADDMFVCAGENIYPSEVEQRIEAHPEVAQAAVVPVPDDIKGAVPVAFVVPKPDASLSEDIIRNFALKNGPAYAHPRRVFLVRELPLAGTNKIDRKALVLMAGADARTKQRMGE